MNVHIESHIKENVDEALEVGEDLTGTELRFSEDAIHEGDGYLLDLVAEVLGAHDDLHLEDVATALN